MPLYDFRCDSGHYFERMVPLAKFEEAQECACGGVAVRVISAPMFSVDTVDYQCPVTGTHIGSMREHRSNLDRQDCRVLETGELEFNARRRAEGEVEFDRKIEETVEREWETLSSESRERIGNELTSGVDISVERK